jgi:DNA polymerase
MAKLVSRHAKLEKWPLLYKTLWRLTHGEPHLLENPADPDVIALAHFEKEVSKDAYRMTAFLRFREMKMHDGSWFVAWYEPEHDSLELNVSFFVERFASMRWSIFTPKKCMHWDGEKLSFSDGVEKSKAPQSDEIEPLWISYYASIFNPARLKIQAMQAQLLKRNWKNLPEAAVIAPLIRHARQRAGAMIEQSEFLRPRESDFSFPEIPKGADWQTVRDLAATCRACPLWKTASCTVFGEGPISAPIVFVGEQPGDQEDRMAKPFVGPAGQILDRALAAANIDRSQAYVTNAVKHFKFEPRGKRRIHKTANAREIAACRPWLDAELDLIQPRLVVALGATAAQSLFGSPLKVLENRGSIFKSRYGFETLVTVHPSSLLRLPDGMNFEAEFEKFVADLRIAQTFLRTVPIEK